MHFPLKTPRGCLRRCIGSVNPHAPAPHLPPPSHHHQRCVHGRRLVPHAVTCDKARVRSARESAYTRARACLVCVSAALSARTRARVQLLCAWVHTHTSMGMYVSSRRTLAPSNCAVAIAYRARLLQITCVIHTRTRIHMHTQTCSSEPFTYTCMCTYYAQRHVPVHVPSIPLNHTLTPHTHLHTCTPTHLHTHTDTQTQTQTDTHTQSHRKETCSMSASSM